MSWSPDEESFVSLSDDAKAELLEGCFLDGSDSSASKLFGAHVLLCCGTWPGYTQIARLHVLSSAPSLHSAAHCCLKHGVDDLSPNSSARLQQVLGVLSFAFRLACQTSTAQRHAPYTANRSHSQRLCLTMDCKDNLMKFQDLVVNIVVLHLSRSCNPASLTGYTVH